MPNDGNNNNNGNLNVVIIITDKKTVHEHPTAGESTAVRYAKQKYNINHRGAGISSARDYCGQQRINQKKEKRYLV